MKQTMTNSKTVLTPTPKVDGIINFHGLTLWVVDHDGTKYIPARPLAALAGVQWKRARTGLFSGDSPKLFGTIELNDPLFNASADTYVPKKQAYIRLDRGRMYLARINTERMRVNNNEDAADRLLTLQIEWAEALHSYETNGIAVKNGRLDTRRKEEQNLASLIKIRKETVSEQEKAALTCMIHDKLSELGYPPGLAVEKQMDLPGVI